MAKAAKKSKKDPAIEQGPEIEGDETLDTPETSAPVNGKNLVVVESPAKAKTINRYLGRDFVVKASMGHVRDLPLKNIGVDVEHDFAPTYEPLAGRRKVLAELKKAARSAQQVFLATDLDREGEAIAWHLAESLRIPPDRIRRVIFNEITATAIREAFAHPRDLDMNKVNAQQARRILDRIVGYKISPLLWKKVATGLSAGRVQSVAVRLVVEREREIDAFIPEEYWKIGSIFTAELAAAAGIGAEWTRFMAQRDEKGSGPTLVQQQEFLASRQAFRAELAKWNGKKFEPDNEAMALEVVRGLGLVVREVQHVEDPAAKGPAKTKSTLVVDLPADGPKYKIANLSQRDSRTRPYAPFTTATLQQAASVQLRFSASRTMRIAQQLYEGIEVAGSGSVGLITYMRTDSTQLSAEAINQARALIGTKFGPQYLPEKPMVYSSAKRAQEAHEAVRATDAARTPESVMAALTDEQFKLYELIWKRFIACQMNPAIWKVTEADIVSQGAAGEAVFKAMGRQLEFDGFLRVVGIPKSTEPLLPALRQDQPVAPVEIEPSQHFTQPPPRYTEASLVKAMEAEGIGRPSTYASIIQTIQDRQYARIEDRSFHPTDLGIVVTDKLVKHFPKIFDVRFTAHMEDELDKIEEQSLNWVQVLRDFYGPFEIALKLAGEEMVHAKAESQPSEYSCHVCGKPMVYRFTKNGRYLACTGYPDCKTTSPVDETGKKVERREVDVPCPKCGKKLVLRRSRFGVFLGCGDYPTCKTIVPCDPDGNPLKVVQPEDVKETCPECQAPMAVKFKGRRAFLGCTRYPECKGIAQIPEGIRIAQPPREPPKDAGVACPKCGRAMVIRNGKRGEFIACSGFPRCRNAMDMSKLDELKAHQAANPPKPRPEKKAPKAKKAK